MRRSWKAAGIFTAVALSLALTGAGCAAHGINVGAATVVVPPAQTTSSVPLSYDGLAIPAREGEPPNQIWIDSYGCYPNVLTIKAGTTVTWVNVEVHPFAVVSDDSLFDGYIYPSPLGFGYPGAGTFSFQFTYPGTFGYSIDQINAQVLGQVIVTG